MINKISTIGIVGGGQLGKMLIIEAKRLGLGAVVLDNDPNCSASCVADRVIYGDYDDLDAYTQLANCCDVVTYEFEHINERHLQQIAKSGKAVYPKVSSLIAIKDKLKQKQFLQKLGVPVIHFAQVLNKAQAKLILLKNGPLFLKARKGGYDGKGNFLCRTPKDIDAAFENLGENIYLESLAEFDCEISVIACRDLQKKLVYYPIAQNIHKDGILDTTVVPCALSKQVQQKALDCAATVLNALDAVGTFCVEFFVKGDSVWINEVAPRVHNTGHYTIEGCQTNQFANHIRAIVGLPLGNTNLLAKSIGTKNILGTDTGKAKFCGIQQALSNDNISLHIYGKAQTRPGRKMGHATAIGDSTKTVQDKLDKCNITVKGE